MADIQTFRLNTFFPQPRNKYLARPYKLFHICILLTTESTLLKHQLGYLGLWLQRRQSRDENPQNWHLAKLLSRNLPRQPSENVCQLLGQIQRKYQKGSDIQLQSSYLESRSFHGLETDARWQWIVHYDSFAKSLFSQSCALAQPSNLSHATCI